MCAREGSQCPGLQCAGVEKDIQLTNRKSLALSNVSFCKMGVLPMVGLFNLLYFPSGNQENTWTHTCFTDP